MAKKQKNSDRQKDMFRGQTFKMPEGYYSGDKPNANLRSFIEAHVRECPYDSSDDRYNVSPFTTPVMIENRRDALNDLHIYWSKKPYRVIRQYVRHYTRPGDLVFDPLSGSGGTALAALMEGRKAVAIDRSPAATFITMNYGTPVNPDAVRSAFDEVMRLAKPDLEWLYATRCDRCSGEASTSYTVHSQLAQCPRCMATLPLFDGDEVPGKTAKGKPKTVIVCPKCRSKGRQEELELLDGRLNEVPVFVSYVCKTGCKPARGERRHNDRSRTKQEYFERYDLGKIREINAATIPYDYPTDRMMNVANGETRWGLLWRPYLSGDFNGGQVLHKTQFVGTRCYPERNLEGLARSRQDVVLLFGGVIQRLENVSGARRWWGAS